MTCSWRSGISQQHLESQFSTRGTILLPVTFACQDNKGEKRRGGLDAHTPWGTRRASMGLVWRVKHKVTWVSWVFPCDDTSTGSTRSWCCWTINPPGSTALFGVWKGKGDWKQHNKGFGKTSAEGRRGHASSHMFWRGGTPYPGLESQKSSLPVSGIEAWWWGLTLPKAGMKAPSQHHKTAEVARACPVRICFANFGAGGEAAIFATTNSSRTNILLKWSMCTSQLKRELFRLKLSLWP